VTFDYYNVLGYDVAVGTNVDAARLAVQRVLGGFGPQPAPQDAGIPAYQITATDAGCRLTRDGAAVYPEAEGEYSDLLSVLGTLEFQVVTAALDHREDLFHLHGAALCLPTRAAGLVLAGESRSGKTTLTLGLMLRGFAPYTDDVTLIDPETFTLHAVRRAFHTAQDTLRILAPLAGGQPAVDDAPRGYFLPPQWASTPVPVKWILFPEYRPGQVPQLIPLSPPEAASAIAKRSTTLSRSPKFALSTTSRLVDNTACYRFLTGDLAETVAMVQRLVAAEG
jgi:hypothetical protein